MTTATNVRSVRPVTIDPTGWGVSYDETWHGPDKWLASNLETGETVFARGLGELAEEAFPLTIERHVSKARREMGEARWAELNAEWL